MLDQFGKIFLTYSILAQDIQQDDPDLVVDGDILVQKDGNDVLHVILDLLPLGISAHGQVLLHLTQLVDVALVVLHALLSQVKVGAEFVPRWKSKW